MPQETTNTEPLSQETQASWVERVDNTKEEDKRQQPWLKMFKMPDVQDPAADDLIRSDAFTSDQFGSVTG